MQKPPYAKTYHTHKSEPSKQQQKHNETLAPHS